MNSLADGETTRVVR